MKITKIYLQNTYGLAVGVAQEEINGRNVEHLRMYGNKTTCATQIKWVDDEVSDYLYECMVDLLSGNTHFDDESEEIHNK